MCRRKYSLYKAVALFCAFLLFTPLFLNAQNEALARKVMDRALALVEHSGGAKLDYEIKVTRLYTQRGTIWYKGNKSLLKAKKSTLWFDGKTVWSYNHKASEVTVSNAKQANRRGLSEMFSYTRRAQLSLTEEPTMYRIRITSSDHNAPAHEAIALIDKKTFHPVQLRMRKSIVWITINIANFETGNWSDDMFQFNPKKYPKLKVIDKR
jgi:outer membrane lipoprotein-sorting protein